MALSFREFLLNEENAYSNMKVKSDNELAADADKIELRKEKREKGKEVVEKLRNRRKDNK